MRNKRFHSHWKTPVFSRAPSRGMGTACPMQRRAGSLWRSAGRRPDRRMGTSHPVLSRTAGCPAGSQAGSQSRCGQLLSDGEEKGLGPDGQGTQTSFTQVFIPRSKGKTYVVLNSNYYSRYVRMKKKYLFFLIF